MGAGDLRSDKAVLRDVKLNLHLTLNRDLY
jgi:hypothetical protein